MWAIKTSLIHHIYLLYIGVPQQPTIRNVFSTSPGVALLDVSTREAGVEEGGTFNFVVRTELVSDGTSTLFVQEVANYVDSSVITLVITNLAGGVYNFTVKVQNEFGNSDFSKPRMLQIQTPIPRSSISVGMCSTVQL